jgi:hypothetical protein
MPGQAPHAIARRWSVNYTNACVPKWRNGRRDSLKHC